MPSHIKKHRKWLIAGSALLLTATPGFALFGIGDIVFDPTSYASLVQQFTTLQMQYNTIKNNVTHFSFKQQWQATLTALKNTNVKNLFGETNGMTTALNTNSPTASSTAWTAATVPISSSTSSYLAEPDIGQRTILTACHDRGVRCHLAGLPHCCRPVPGGADTERNGSKHAWPPTNWMDRMRATAKFSS